MADEIVADHAHYSGGNVWIEIPPQDYFRHLEIATEINAGLRVLAKELGLGRYFADGAWVTNSAVGVSTQPDGLYVLWDTFRSGEARFVPRPDDKGPIELVGRGDMVLEIVSDSSETKDLQDLMSDYATMGFREYWVVDARRDPLSFRILTLDDGSYGDVEPGPDGWLRSPIWSREFHLRRSTDPLGQPTFDLDHRLTDHSPVSGSGSSGK